MEEYGRNLGRKVIYTYKPVIPIMSSKAPCIVSGVSGICLQIILFIL